MDKLKYEQYIINGENVEYQLRKGGILYIKPIILKNYFEYTAISSMLLLQKNEIDNGKYISSSFIDFLNDIQDSDGNYIKYCIIKMSELCFGYDKIAFVEDNGRLCFALCDDNSTIEKIIRPKEFEEIKKIILYQNNIDYDDREISEDMKKIVNQYYEIKYKDINTPSLEMKKAFVSSKIGKFSKELNELTIREFDLIYKNCIDSENYYADKIIQGSYKYDVKENILHPLFVKKKDIYEEVLSGKSDLAMLDGMENVGI